MVSVLFVCLGNICRSPMAEAVLRHKIKQRGLQDKISVDSAGTGDWHIGNVPHEGTRKLLDSWQISYEGMVARKVESQDLVKFDYVIGMDDSNVANLRKLAGSDQAAILKFMDLLPDEKLREVPDPYFTGNFEEVYRLIDAGCDILLDKIMKEKL
ncbi:low molecular weight phosphotyrosine protein phosphatase [Paenibacillus lautus]|uniref:low molecular weight protein-tyrosine-phosphatase n=1 Tax=Paenibacillus lautus TaxID=1401 RepID=UPI002DBF14A9|nr:low molecular weight protein-tyrosine-phosphatase [Paenibacillus lautus]MEC0205006.1 low molecular weight phosphotyrosine protein phosphatase [Paenibacillus lautus]